MSRIYDSNRNSRIVTRNRPNTAFARETFTSQRDEGTLNAFIQTESNNATTLVIDTGNGVTARFNGNQARTLFALLEKHYYGN